MPAPADAAVARAAPRPAGCRCCSPPPSRRGIGRLLRVRLLCDPVDWPRELVASCARGRLAACPPWTARGLGKHDRRTTVAAAAPAIAPRVSQMPPTINMLLKPNSIACSLGTLTGSMTILSASVATSGLPVANTYGGCTAQAARRSLKICYRPACPASYYNASLVRRRLPNLHVGPAGGPQKSPQVYSTGR